VVVASSFLSSSAISSQTFGATCTGSPNCRACKVVVTARTVRRTEEHAAFVEVDMVLLAPILVALQGVAMVDLPRWNSGCFYVSLSRWRSGIGERRLVPVCQRM